MTNSQYTTQGYLSVVAIMVMALVFVNCSRNHEFTKDEDINVIATQPVATTAPDDNVVTNPTGDGVDYTPTPTAGIGSSDASGAPTICDSVCAASVQANVESLSGQQKSLNLSTAGALYNSRTWELVSDESLASEVYGVLVLASNNRVSGNQSLVSSFERLKTLDTAGGNNGGDGVVDGFDSQFSNLRLWIDRNNDGMVGSDNEAMNELVTMQQAGIVSISVRALSEFNESTDGADIGPKAVVRFDTVDLNGNVLRGIVFEKTSR